MIITKASISDKHGIQQLINELDIYRTQIFDEKNTDFHRKTQPHVPITEEDLKNDIFFIACNESDKIIGFIEGSIHQRKNYTLHTLGSIDTLFVMGTYRKKGIAKKLFLELEKEFKRLGCDHIVTHTDSENQLSQEFYKYMDMNKTTIEFWKNI